MPTPPSSSAAPTRSSSASSNAGPIICMPTGRPAALNPHGSESAGYPERVHAAHQARRGQAHILVAAAQPDRGVADARRGHGRGRRDQAIHLFHTWSNSRRIWRRKRCALM
jgi:hypothetical protein